MQRFSLHFLVGFCGMGLMVFPHSSFLCGQSSGVSPGVVDSEVTPAISHRPSKLSLPDALMLGLIEGATEYLPVSSTGHLLLYQKFREMSHTEAEEDAAESLAICIQLGAILAVVLLYFRRLRQMIYGVFGRDEHGKTLAICLIIAFLPAAVLGLLFREVIKEHLFGVAPVAAALFTGGVLILLTAVRIRAGSVESGKQLTELTVRDALLVGLVQCVAFWPGFSRSLAAILGCLLVGLRLSAAVEFSFLLGLVTLSAATIFEGLQSGSEIVAQYGVATPLLALVTAFVAAALSIKFMIGALNRWGLAPFGYYRIALAAVCAAWLLQAA